MKFMIVQRRAFVKGCTGNSVLIYKGFTFAFEKEGLEKKIWCALNEVQNCARVFVILVIPNLFRTLRITITSLTQQRKLFNVYCG